MNILNGMRMRRSPPLFSCFQKITVLAIVLLSGLAACSGQNAGLNPTTESNPRDATQAIPQTGSGPDCSSPTKLTPALTEGPFFKADSPERTSLLESGMKGTKLILSGYVFTPDCSPAAHALLDFWQANVDGQYDNSGYTLRGHQYTDATGHYELTTIVPGLYPGRTEHIHVKVQAPGGSILTTQLFFPGVPENNSDGIFNPTLVMNVEQTTNGLTATFNFIVSSQ